MTTRALVYAFHDLDGVVDDAYLAIIEAMAAPMARSIVVSNGTLADDGRARLEALGVEVIERDNAGYDVGAFRAGLDALGDLSSIDELVIANSSVFGPLRSFDDVFADMDAREVDFWGITRHAGTRGTGPWSGRAHVQSYFMAFRRSVLGSDAFRDYWASLPEITTYADAVQLHEMRVTGYLEDAGFRWDTLVDTQDIEAWSENPVIAAAAELVGRGIPVFKRRMLYLDLDGLLAHSAGGASRDLWEAIAASRLVDLEALTAHVNRTMRTSDVRTALQRFVRIDEGTIEPLDAVGVAILPGPLAQESIDHFRALVPGRVWLLRDRKGTGLPSGLDLDGVHVVDTGDRPPMLSLDRVDADLVFVAGDIPKAGLRANARIARDHARLSVGWDADELGRVAHALAQSPTTGLVVAPPSVARTFYGAIGGLKPKVAAALEPAASALVPGVRAATELPAVTPGTSFWIRREAAAAWSAAIDGLPAAARSRLDGLLPSALQSLLQLAAPRLGHDVVLGASRRLGETTIALSTEMFARINRAAGTNGGEPFDAFTRGLSTTHVEATLFFDTGSGFRHSESRTVRLRQGEPATVTATAPPGTIAVRFDPAEGVGVVIEGAAVDGDARLVPVNGTRSRGIDVFSTHDPIYHVSPAPAPGETLTLRFASITALSAPSETLLLLESRLGLPAPVRIARTFVLRGGAKAKRMLRGGR